MAANFKMSIHRKNASLELKLTGDFDGTSACELLDVLGKDCRGIERVIINTRGLKAIFPFGVDTFRNNLYLLKHRGLHLVFRGKNATTIAPEGDRFFRFFCLTTRPREPHPTSRNSRLKSVPEVSTVGVFSPT